MAQTKIGWCSTKLHDGTVIPGYTFNPWVGCCKVSAGCKNCYAEAMQTPKKRWANAWGPPGKSDRVRTSDAYWKKPIKWNRDAMETGVRRRVFCGSLMDVFEDNDDLLTWRSDLFGIIDQTPYLDWLLLTKRPENIQSLWPWGYYDDQFSWPNVWAGTSVENQETANKRIPPLLEIPAAVRFLSVEPLLGDISIYKWIKNIDWVIVGGESGRNRRTMAMYWMENICAQCNILGTPLFIKQDSALKPGRRGRIPDSVWARKEFPDGR